MNSPDAILRAALADADDISERIARGGYRASLSDVERLRNHVRRLVALTDPAKLSLSGRQGSEANTSAGNQAIRQRMQNPILPFPTR